MNVPSEHQEQKAVMEWAAWMSGQMPALRLLYAVPNGGHRKPATGARLKDEGVKPGVPDLHLPLARKGWHSLFIEMKQRKGGRLSPDQKWWIEMLEREGNRVEVCQGFDEARAVLLDYLK